MEAIWMLGKKRRPPQISGTLAITGAGGRTRTADLRITSALLYQLSYTGSMD